MSHLSLALLGPPDIRLDGAPLGFKTQKTQALLIYLALESAYAHSREELVGLLWPEYSPQAAHNNLRVSLHRLRKALREREEAPFNGAPTPFLWVTSKALQFNRASAHALDVAAFYKRLADTRQHPHECLERCAECATRLTEAVTLYRGDFLTGFTLHDSIPFEEWAVIQREALHQQVLYALDQLAAFHERRGEYAAMCDYARRQIELEPWLESAHRRLMRGLMCAGNRAAALAQYEICRRRLAQELGIEPAPETRALWERIRASGSAAPPTTKVGMLRQNVSTLHDVPTPSPLPTPLTPLIGRKSELTQIDARLAEPGCRLLSLVGLGGMGKTRLALEAARARQDAFPHGIVFVSVATLRSATELVAAIAQALGFTLAPERAAKPQLLDYLREKRLLLLLDHFECLQAQGPYGAALVEEILQFAPDVQILVTSWEKLNVEGEYVWLVQGLDYPHTDTADAAQFPAVQLFWQSAHRVQPNLTLDAAQLHEVVRICRLVEGMPLALELAAAWTEVLPPAEIAAEIEKSIDFLQNDWPGAPERRRSLRAVLDESWNLLSESERTALQRLAVFRGGFTRHTAQTVADVSLHTLTALARKSLLRLERPDEHAPRYTMLEWVRRYAFDKLRAAREHEEMLNRHLDFFCQLGIEGECEVIGKDQALWIERLETEHDNLRAVLERTLSEGTHRLPQGLRLAGALWWFWILRDHLTEGQMWLERALAKTAGQPELATARTRLLPRTAFLTMIQGDDNQATALATETLARSQEIHDPYTTGMALLVLGALARQTDLVQAKEQVRAGLELFRALGNQWGEQLALSMLEPLAATNLLL